MRGKWIALCGLFVAGQLMAAEIPVWAMMLNGEWHDAYNSRNLDGFKSYYAEDVRLNDVRGYKSAMRSIEEEWKQENLHCTGGFVDFDIVDKYASAWGVGTCKPKDGPKSEAFRTEWLTVFERQSGDDWKVILEEWTE